MTIRNQTITIIVLQCVCSVIYKICVISVTQFISGYSEYALGNALKKSFRRYVRVWHCRLLGRDDFIYVI